MVDEGDGLALGRADGPTAAPGSRFGDRHCSGGQSEGPDGGRADWGRTRPHGVAVLGLGLGPGVIGREAGGSANCLVLPFQFMIEEGLSGGVARNALEEEEGHQTLLEGAEAAFTFPLA